MVIMATESESKPSEVKLTITNEKVNTSDVTQGIAVDLNERDPNNLHEDLKVNRCCVLIAFGVCSVEGYVSVAMYCFQRLGIYINANKYRYVCVYKKCASRLFSASCTGHVKFVDYH